MTILRERTVWRRVRTRARNTDRLDLLTPAEEAHVRAALRVLRRRHRTWRVIAMAMRVPIKTLERIVSGRDRRVPAGLAIRTARLAGVPVDDVLSGRFPPTGACPTCGRCE